MLTNTHRECTPVGSGAASVLLSVLVNKSASCHPAFSYGARCGEK